MSRIHEALKKAEQDRATVLGATAAGVPAPEMPDMTQEAQIPAAPSNLGPQPLTPAFGSSFNPETLLARCPQLDWKADATTMLFMNGNDSAPGTEEFRTLRSRLYSLRERVPLRKLLITSALPKDGKSFTAANLAQVLVRQHGRRVLLIDADLRGPSLHEMLGTSSAPGLSEYLQGQNDEFSIMQRGALENLFFIPSGHATTDPSELIGSGRLQILMQRLEPLFDWIILDSPPAVAVSDASMLAKACDGVLMVVRSNVTPSDAAQRALQEFPEKALVGVVLNGTSGDGAQYARYYNEAYETKATQA
jgi:protein-tyrosine kinase